MDTLHRFYCSKAWRDLAYVTKIKAKGICRKCGAFVPDFSQLIAHHKQELSAGNVHDSSVALNPDNIEAICFACHNKEHRRFGHKKQVYIVYGPPLAGKTTLVREMMRYGDIVLDIDALWAAITFQPAHVKPDNCRFNVFALRDNLLGQIKMRHGQWSAAWVIGGYPERHERERLAYDLGAELVYCEVSETECLARVEVSGRPPEWRKYIAVWFERYAPPASENV